MQHLIGHPQSHVMLNFMSLTFARNVDACSMSAVDTARDGVRNKTISYGDYITFRAPRGDSSTLLQRSKRRATASLRNKTFRQSDSSALRRVCSILNLVTTSMSLGGLAHMREPWLSGAGRVRC